MQRMDDPPKKKKMAIPELDLSPRNPSEIIVQDKTAFYNPEEKRHLTSEWSQIKSGKIYKMAFEWAKKRYPLRDDPKDVNADSEIFTNDLYKYCKADLKIFEYRLKIDDGKTLVYAHPGDYERLEKRMGEILGQLEGIEKAAGKAFSDFFMGLVYGKDVDGELFKLIESHPKGKEKCHFILALMHCEGVKGQETIGGKIREIDKRIAVLERYGIESPNRYSAQHLENHYLAVSEGRMLGKLGIAMFPKDDWNGAFYQKNGLLDQMLENGHTVLICESGGDDEFRQRWANRGLLENDPWIKSKEVSKRKYAGALWMAHGWEKGMGLKDGFGEQNYFTVSDKGWAGKYDWSAPLEKNAAVALISCSTGADRGYRMGIVFLPPVPLIAPYFVRKENFMEFAAKLTGADVHAPGHDSYGSRLKFTGGYISGMEYKTDFSPSKYLGAKSASSRKK